jgi:hypothetical protein
MAETAFLAAAGDAGFRTTSHEKLRQDPTGTAREQTIANRRTGRYPIPSTRDRGSSADETS